MGLARSRLKHQMTSWRTRARRPRVGHAVCTRLGLLLRSDGWKVHSSVGRHGRGARRRAAAGEVPVSRRLRPVARAAHRREQPPPNPRPISPRSVCTPPPQHRRHEVAVVPPRPPGAFLTPQRCFYLRPLPLVQLQASHRGRPMVHLFASMESRPAATER